jgi:1-acyl-sn-glycerol-3-phosphate acyltransferase
MWSAAIVAGAALAIWIRWRRSGLCWNDFWILRGARVYAHLWHRWSCNHPARLPDGPLLMIANHTCSADPNFLLAGCARPLSFLVAREHFDLHPLTRAILDHLRCVPVSRNGKDAIALRMALRRLEEGGAVCLFPEGNLSGVPARRTLPAKHGIGYLALRTRVPVYLAHISGGPQTERLLDSWLRPSSQAVRVHFSGPVDLSAYRRRPVDRRLIVEVTEYLMAQIEKLGVTKDGLSLSPSVV